MGAAQILICFHSCVFWPPVSTAIRTSVFSFVGALSVLLCIPYRDCLVDHVDLICSMYSWWEGLGLLPQPHCPWVSTVVLFPPLHVGCPLVFAPEAALEDLGLSLGGPGVEVVQLLGLQGFWPHQLLRGVGS